MTREKIIAALEAGESGREMDGDIFETKIDREKWNRAYNQAQEPCGCPHDMAVKGARRRAPHYTTSLDASIPGENIIRVWRDGRGWHAEQAVEGAVSESDATVTATAPTEACARRAAALKGIEEL